MIDFSTRWADYALYLPAVNNTYARFAAQALSKTLKARLPDRLKPSDFDFLSPNSKLTRWPNILYSATFGVKDGKPTIISARNRSKSFVLGDSGGFSLIGGGVKASHASFRKVVLDWQERDCDIGIILDVPTRSLTVPASGYTRFEDCLDQTTRNIEFALGSRSNADLRLLNVMQGLDHSQARTWFNAVAHYPLEGLAIAGHTRLDLWFWIGRFLEMINRGQFERVSHIHFLGTAEPGFAVMATALQRALRKHVRPNITVSFDSSNGFHILGRYGQISTGLGWPHGKPGFARHTLPQKGGDVLRAGAFPFESPIADRCTVGDFLPGKDPYGPAGDAVGGQMLANHTVHVELASILQANRLVDMAQVKGSLVPHDIQMAVEGIRAVFEGDQPGKALTRYKRFLSIYGSKADDTRAGDVPA